MALRKISIDMFEALITEAKASPRKRKNFNFHHSPEEPLQRMLNALEPETYARPHRHPGRAEVFLCLQGRAVLFIFDDEGNVIESCAMAPGGPILGADVEPGTWHTIIAMETGTILYEVEPGPYDPATSKEFAPWSPTEESGEGPSFNRTFIQRWGGT